MSEPEKTPENYFPNNKPEILNLMEDDVRTIEKLAQTMTYKGAENELARRTDVIWAGCVDYAKNNFESSVVIYLQRHFYLSYS